MMFLAALFVLAPKDAHAWKPKHHIYTGNEAAAEIFAGQDYVTIDGRQYAVAPEIAQALRNQPGSYRAGCIGPDGFPDLTFGQMIVHPDWKADDGTYTHEWLNHIHDTAWEYYRAHNGDALGQQALAFMYGYLTHAGGDLWGHTLINSFAGGSWPEIPGGDISIAVRHIIVEEYISQRVPATDMTISVPTDFIYQMFIANRKSFDMGKNASISDKFGIPYFLQLRADLVATRNGIDCDWWQPWDWVDCIKGVYINAWIVDIDDGLVAWPDAMARVGQHLFVNEADGHMDAAKREIEHFAYRHLLSMYGAPDFVGSFLEGMDAFIGWIESLLRINIPGISDIIMYIIESAYGIDFDALKDYFAHPVNYINQAPLFASDTSARLDALMHLNGAGFDRELFAANRNTITLGRMILLGPDELNRLLAAYKVGPLFGGENDAVPVGMRENIMLGFIRSLDGDHQWRRTPMDNPNLRHSEGMTLWVDCQARKLVFRSLFTDWEEHDPAANFPDAQDACECWNDLPPTISVAFNRDVLWPANHKLSPITAEVTVVDDCDPAPTFALVSITSNEPDDGRGDGNTKDDIQDAVPGAPDVDFLLRAERLGGGEDRIYTIAYAAMDAAGNADTTDFHIRVTHDRSGTALAAVGTGVAGPEPSIVLVIPSATNEPKLGKPGVARISPDRAFVGNHLLQVAPRIVRVADVTGDGMEDLMLVFHPGAAVLDRAARWNGREERLGLRYEDRSGAGYLVADILALGAPLVLREDLTGPLDGAADARSGIVPTVTALVGIRPNPFNPSATVSFELASTGQARIAVYDLRGTLVRSLSSGILDAGRHEVTWDGRDNRGLGVSSGVYFVRLVAPGVTQTMKAILAK
jgi:hypothetical protein